MVKFKKGRRSRYPYGERRQGTRHQHTGHPARRLAGGGAENRRCSAGERKTGIRVAPFGTAVRHSRTSRTGQRVVFYPHNLSASICCFSSANLPRLFLTATGFSSAVIRRIRSIRGSLFWPWTVTGSLEESILTPASLGLQTLPKNKLVPAPHRCRLPFMEGFHKIPITLREGDRGKASETE